MIIYADRTKLDRLKTDDLFLTATWESDGSEVSEKDLKQAKYDFMLENNIDLDALKITPDGNLSYVGHKICINKSDYSNLLSIQEKYNELIEEEKKLFGQVGFNFKD